MKKVEIVDTSLSLFVDGMILFVKEPKCSTLEDVQIFRKLA